MPVQPIVIWYRVMPILNDPAPSERKLPRRGEQVVVVGLDMEFSALVSFFIKVVLAAIPALVLFYAVWFIGVLIVMPIMTRTLAWVISLFH